MAMERRRLLLLALAGAMGPRALHAQLNRSIAKVAILGVASATSYAAQVSGFRRGLEELGYVEGKNVALDFRWANGDTARLPALAAELVRDRPDVLVTSGPGTAVAKRATSAIPIVMAATGNAVETGLVASLARPGGNVTGSSFLLRELNGKRLELLKEAVPGLRRVGLLLHVGSGSNTGITSALSDLARSLDVDILSAEIRETADVGRALDRFVQERAEALLVVDHTIFVAQAARIVGLVRQRRLPAVGFAEIAETGGLLAYAVDFADLWHRAATFVDKILKGAKPSDLPVEQPTKFLLTVNQRTARELGIRISRSLLLRADRVID